MRQLFTLVFLASVISNQVQAQGCCSGGSGSPIAGGASQGVLLDRQVEVGLTYQYFNSNKFMAHDRDTAKLFDYYRTQYMYLRFAYGVTKDFTLSVESGFYMNKTQMGLNKADTITSSGIGDLVIFPRYDVYNHTTETRRTEVTLGLGYKIPLGKYDDSTVVYRDPTTNKRYYTPSPPSVQPSTGSHDFIFYGFAYRGYPTKNFRVFTTLLYIKKGYNALGEKFGDYASIGLFAGKTFFKKLGVTLQVKGEWIDKMKAAKNVDLLAFYNVDVQATGSRRVSLVPQLNYSVKKFTFFAMSEFPIYQFVNKQQVANKTLITAGMAYRFLAYKQKTAG